MTKTLKLVRIGDSQGIRIQLELIQRHQLGGTVRVTETAAGLLLQPLHSKKLSLAESFAEMAKDPRAMVEAAEWERLRGVFWTARVDAASPSARRTRRNEARSGSRLGGRNSGFRNTKSQAPERGDGKEV